MGERYLQTPSAVKKEGVWCSRCQNRDSPAACEEEPDEASCPPAAQGGAQIQLELRLELVDAQRTL